MSDEAFQDTIKITQQLVDEDVLEEPAVVTHADEQLLASVDQDRERVTDLEPARTSIDLDVYILMRACRLRRTQRRHIEGQNAFEQRHTAWNVAPFLNLQQRRVLVLQHL